VSADAAGVAPLERARTLNVWRRLGYRLLPGDAFSYILHLRPAEWPIMAAHTLLGFVLAVGLGPALRGTDLATAAWALAIWVVLLNGGTLAINSVFDRDQGDIGYLNAPPAPPRHLLAFSLALLIAGQAAAFTLPRGFTLVYAVCFAMSLAYSVPPLRLKAIGGADWVINMLGFGTFTPYAGWAATGRPLDLPHGLVLLAFCPLFAALYPLTQLYQFEEDRRRGDRTLAIILGMRRSLGVAIGCTLVAFALFAAGAVRLDEPGCPGGAGRPACGPEPWQWGALAVALAAWLWVLVPWWRHHERWSSGQHQRGMYAALGAWAVTDAAVLVAFGL
jgi:4-hydroxybenzoate polyprenyltransferase